MTSPTLTSSPALAGSHSPRIGLDSGPLRTPKSAPTPPASSNTGGQEFRTLAMCEPWTPPDCSALAMLTSLRLACLASLRACSVPGVELLTNAGCGRTPCESSASFDPASASLRTRQLSLLSKADEPSTELLVDWPRSAMWDATMFYPLPPLVQAISVNVSSSLLPTCIANDGKGSDYCGHPSGSRILKLGGAVKLCLLPTPTARAWKDTPGMARERKDGTSRLDRIAPRLFAVSNATTGLKLNPRWCLWFMGYPPDWLHPLYAALETPLSRKSRSASSMPST